MGVVLEDGSGVGLAKGIFDWPGKDEKGGK